MMLTKLALILEMSLSQILRRERRTKFSTGELWADLWGCNEKERVSEFIL